jgi:isoleucyl-tRNA synthetase
VKIEDAETLRLASAQKDYIANEVRASSLDMGSALEIKGKLVKDWEIEDLQIKIGVDKI